MNSIRHNKIVLKPIVITNENIKFPVCYKCDQEKSPFFLKDGSLIGIVKDNLKTYSNEIFFDSVWEREGGGLIIFLCKKCTPKISND